MSVVLTSVTENLFSFYCSCSRDQSYMYVIYILCDCVLMLFGMVSLGIQPRVSLIGFKVNQTCIHRNIYVYLIYIQICFGMRRMLRKLHIRLPIACSFECVKLIRGGRCSKRRCWTDWLWYYLWALYGMGLVMGTTNQTQCTKVNGCAEFPWNDARVIARWHIV